LTENTEDDKMMFLSKTIRHRYGIETQLIEFNRKKNLVVDSKDKTV